MRVQLGFREKKSAGSVTSLRIQIKPTDATWRYARRVRRRRTAMALSPAPSRVSRPGSGTVQLPPTQTLPDLTEAGISTWPDASDRKIPSVDIVSGLSPLAVAVKLTVATPEPGALQRLQRGVVEGGVSDEEQIQRRTRATGEAEAQVEQAARGGPSSHPGRRYN